MFSIYGVLTDIPGNTILENIMFVNFYCVFLQITQINLSSWLIAQIFFLSLLSFIVVRQITLANGAVQEYAISFL